MCWNRPRRPALINPLTQLLNRVPESVLVVSPIGDSLETSLSGCSDCVVVDSWRVLERDGWRITFDVDGDGDRRRKQVLVWCIYPIRRSLEGVFLACR